jgi:hypothetical protein
LKKRCFCAAFTVIFSLFLHSCSYYGEKRDVAFVYAISLENAKSGVAVGFLKSAPDGNDNGGASENESVKDKRTIKLEYEEVFGKDVNEAFDEFYEKHSDVYINSANFYAFSPDFDGENLYDFAKYLVNSNKLPLKRGAVLCENPSAFFERCAKEFDSQKFEKSYAEVGETVNIVYFLSASAQNEKVDIKEVYFSDGKIKVKRKEK